VRDVSKGVRSGLFTSHSHTVTFARQLSKAFDAGQGFDHFIGVRGKAQFVDLGHVSVRPDEQ
jgi:hypothetical protein